MLGKKILKYEIFKKWSLIHALLKGFEIIETRIAQSGIIEIYFRHLREFLANIFKKWRNRRYMERFPHRIDIILHRGSTHIECIRELMHIKQIPHLTRENFQEIEVLVTMLYPRIYNVFFDIRKQEFIETFPFFFLAIGEYHIRVSSVHHVFVIER